VQFCVLPHAGEHAERCGMLSPRRRKLRLRIGDNISPRTRVARDGIRVTYDTRGEGEGNWLPIWRLKTVRRNLACITDE
jgi:hypothetical protein